MDLADHVERGEASALLSSSLTIEEEEGVNITSNFDGSFETNHQTAVNEYDEYENDPDERSNGHASWLAAVLVLPGKLAVGVLSLLAGAGAARRAGASIQASALGGIASVLVGQVLVKVASHAARKREREEAHRARLADGDSMAWSDALQAVGKIVSKFADGLSLPAGLKYVFLDRSLVLLYHNAVVEKNKLAARKGPRSSTDALVAGRYYSEYAMAVYGYLLLKLLGMIHPSHDFMVDGGRTIDVVKYRLQLADNQILIARLDGEVIGIPRHFVAVDHEMHAVVVTIRGTNSVSDVITDLLCGNEPFAGGYAHAGMKDAAESLFNFILPTLRTALVENFDYSIVVCGHSLGGGVALLLAKILLMNGFPSVKCYAIAPCPVFGPRNKIDSEWSDAVECYVHDEDLVSQLCLASARNLVLEIERVDALPLTKEERRKFKDRAKAEQLRIIVEKERRDSQDPREKDVQQLFIPTRRGVHWLLPAENDNRGSESQDTGHFESEKASGLQIPKPRSSNYGTATIPDPEDVFVDFPWGNWNIPPASRPKRRYDSFLTDITVFERMLVTPRCVTAHFPNSYASALASLPIPPPTEIPTPPRVRRQFQRHFFGELG